jgi:hypothetical protein
MRYRLMQLHPKHSAFFLWSALVISALLAATTVEGQDPDGAGAVVSAKASSQDVGLPLYPGSKPHTDKDSSSSSANLGLWGGGSGFKLAVLKMESSDSVEKISAFYKKALSKYGPVLDCSSPPPASDKSSKDGSKALTCGDDKADRGGYLFKSGTKEKQHMVAIEPKGQGTIYTLLNLSAWNAK